MTINKDKMELRNNISEILKNFAKNRTKNVSLFTKGIMNMFEYYFDERSFSFVNKIEQLNEYTQYSFFNSCGHPIHIIRYLDYWEIHYSEDWTLYKKMHVTRAILFEEAINKAYSIMQKDKLKGNHKNGGGINL